MCEAAHSGFETQRRHQHKSKTVVSAVPQKGLMSSKDFSKQKFFFFLKVALYIILINIFYITRMYSSRMCTGCCHRCLSQRSPLWTETLLLWVETPFRWTETPQTENTHPGQRPPSPDRDPLDRDPLSLARDPQTETPMNRHPIKTETPLTKTETPPPTIPPVNRQMPVKTLPCQYRSEHG